MLNKVGSSLSSAVLLASIFSINPAFAAGQEMVEICHKPGTASESTMTVAAPSLKGHLKHGDYEGACRGPASTGCTILNENNEAEDSGLPKTITTEFNHYYTDLEFNAGETIHVEVTLSALADSSSVPVGFTAVGNSEQYFVYNIGLAPVGGASETVTSDYTVTGDEGLISVSAQAWPGNDPANLESISYTCTPSP